MLRHWVHCQRCLRGGERPGGADCGTGSECPGRAQGMPHGLLGRMRAGAACAPHAPRHHVLQGEARRCARRHSLARGRPGSEAFIPRQAGRSPGASGGQPLLRPSAQGGAEGCGHHRPLEPGRIQSGRRIRGTRAGPHHDPRRNHRRGGEKRPAWQRRCRLPRGAQVAQRSELRRMAEVYRVQRRRGRPGSVHGRLHDGGQPPCRHRGHDHRRAGHRRRDRCALHPRRVRLGTRAYPTRYR